MTGAVTITTASEAVKGKAQIATQAEVNAGTDDTKFVTAKTINVFFATTFSKGICNPSDYFIPSSMSKGIIYQLDSVNVTVATHAPCEQVKPALQLEGKAQSVQPLPSETQVCTSPLAVHLPAPALHCEVHEVVATPARMRPMR